MADKVVETPGAQEIPKSIYIHTDRVLEILSERMNPAQIGEWMHTRIPKLRSTPAQALFKGKVGNVIVAANEAVGNTGEKFPTSAETLKV